VSRIEKALEKAAEQRGSREKDEPGIVEKSIKKKLPEESGEAYSSAPVWTAEPAMDMKLDHPMLITYRDPRSPISEEFRKLKSSLVTHAREGNAKKALMITSCLSGEGKSVTAINLAITLAQEYDHTVLLVDADLRKPSVHKYFRLTPKRGLADCLSEGSDIGPALIKTGIGRLSILPAGREVENPAELLGSQRMKALVHEMRQRYPDRFIIFDCPPVLSVAETRSLSSFVDGILFVVKEGMVSRTHVLDALGAINEKKVLGIIYNHIENESLMGRYHYYYHGY
jgi:protein-tyrosine kinase